jgi:hypothetical protein
VLRNAQQLNRSVARKIVDKIGIYQAVRVKQMTASAALAT